MFGLDSCPLFGQSCQSCLDFSRWDLGIPMHYIHPLHLVSRIAQHTVERIVCLYQVTFSIQNMDTIFCSP